MLRVLVGLILLPFAMLGLFFAFVMIVGALDTIDKHTQYPTHAKATR